MENIHVRSGADPATFQLFLRNNNNNNNINIPAPTGTKPAVGRNSPKPPAFSSYHAPADTEEGLSEVSSCETSFLVLI